MANKSKSTIVFTGGHGASTAYTVMKELQRQYSTTWNICWVGAEFNFEGSKSETFAKKVFPKLGIEFVPIITGRIQRKFTLWTIPALLKIPVGFFHAFMILKRLKPKLVVSFGGFAAYPIVVISWFMNIPVIIHEQTSVAGRANKYSAFFAKQIALSRPTSRRHFFKHTGKIVVTGNPILGEISKLKPKYKLSHPPVIFITGGKSGSQIINNTITKIIPTLLEDYVVIHQTGPLQFDDITNFKKTLDSKKVQRYQIYDVLEPKRWVEISSKADILISRSGANIVSQILVTKTPSIFIPLPFSYMDEQNENAKFAHDLGLAHIINQKDLTSEGLLKEIKLMLRNWYDIKNKVSSYESVDSGATEKIIELIQNYL